MNITPWTIYWITRLDEIGCVLTVLAFFVGFYVLFMLMSTIGFPNDEPQWKKERAKYFFYGVTVFFALLFGNALIPSTKDMAAIIVIPKIVNNKQVAELPSKIVDLATDWLDHLKPKYSK